MSALANTFNTADELDIAAQVASFKPVTTSFDLTVTGVERQVQFVRTISDDACAVVGATIGGKAGVEARNRGAMAAMLKMAEKALSGNYDAPVEALSAMLKEPLACSKRNDWEAIGFLIRNKKHTLTANGKKTHSEKTGNAIGTFANLEKAELFYNRLNDAIASVIAARKERKLQAVTA